MRSANSRGFTLVEIMVSMAILAFLGFFAAQSVRQAVRSKSKIQSRIDYNGRIQAAIELMKRDIGLAFNYRDVHIELYNLSQRDRKKKWEAQKAQPNPQTPNPGQGGTPPPGQANPMNPTNPPVDPNEQHNFEERKAPILTQFMGDSDLLNFTSLSNIRSAKDSPSGRQAEIGYFLKDCKARLDTKGISSKCLWRRAATVIDDDLTQGGTEVVILENVTDLKFRYLGPGRETEWIDSWRSKDTQDDTTRGLFPYAVEVSLSVKNMEPKLKDTRLSFVAAIRFPNNPKQGQQGNADGTGTQTGPLGSLPGTPETIPQNGR